MMIGVVLILALQGACFGMPWESTDIPENSTAIPIDCTLYRPYPLDSHMYEVFTLGKWENRTCVQALVWDQDLCRCENPPSAELECGKQAVPGSETQFQNVVWGMVLPELLECPRNQLWNQTTCRCVWDPIGPGGVIESPDFVVPNTARSCDIMFNATFDKAIQEHQANYYIGQKPWDSIKIEEIEGANGGGAARVDNGQMVIWSLSGNDFSDAFQIQLRFMAMNRIDQYVTLFSNDCSGDNATVIVKYNTASNRYEVFFRAFNSSETLECIPQSSPQGFVSISLEYQKENLLFVVDGQVACGPTSFMGQPYRSGCPLTLGGDPLADDNNLQGYLDEVVIRRNCLEEANTGDL